MLAAAGYAALAVAVLAIAAITLIPLYVGRGARLSALGVFYVGLPAVALLWLRSDEPFGFTAVLFVFAVVWSSDTAAYAAGRSIGGPKLWPRVSPNKTWAGLAGALTAGALAGGVFAILEPEAPALRLVMLGIGLAFVAQAGDLAESALKRLFNLKDASDLIPGHGGFMDRMDSIVAAAVAAALLALADRSARPGARPAVRNLDGAGTAQRHGAYRIGQRPPDQRRRPGAAHADHPRRHRLHRQEHARPRRAQPGCLRDRRADRAEQRRRAGGSRPPSRARLAVIGDPARYAELVAALAGSGIRAAAGPAAVIEAAAEPADCVMAAIVGAAGLEPTFAAARQGRRLALANKECLVSAGEVFMAAVAMPGKRRRWAGMRAPSCCPSTASTRRRSRRWRARRPKASSASC